MNTSDLNNLTLAQKKFVENLKKAGRATATILAYRKDISQLAAFVNEKKKNQVTQITAEDVEAFKKQLSENNYTPKSISRKINSTKTFFRFLKEAGVVANDPTQNVKHPKYQINPPRILSALEYRALRDVCRDDVRISAIVELLLQTGMRIGELGNLSLDDIKDKTIIIKAYESHSQREIPLNKASSSTLNRYLAIKPKSKSKSLFITKTGRKFLVRNIRTSINRYFKLAGIKNATVNDLRNTFIAHQLKAGTPLVVVSRLVGHKRLVTTEKYLQVAKQPKENNGSVKIEEL
ncbi:tyrosine-type recombinase/integrase [Patescibacteria group bacterium]|nr:tyrosine-type recombinase/integrase [Patescibacteria group bacterium]MBU1931526.1 tyrosine-type recombinase/integrase [Patescibacteria group bacterium]